MLREETVLPNGYSMFHCDPITLDTLGTSKQSIDLLHENALGYCHVQTLLKEQFRTLQND